MGIKPPDADIVTVHTYWDSPEGFQCPICSDRLEYAYNDGGRLVETLKGKLWVVSNYYRCKNSECKLSEAFRIFHKDMIPNKKYGKDVWETVVRFHFKHHLDYEQIKGIIYDIWAISISKATIGRICTFFKGASELHLDEKISREVRETGFIILSLDGAQPKKGRPALWIFSDRMTGNVLLSVMLNSAAAPILKEKIQEIHEKFGVPIKAVISDKQKNIVNAVRDFDPDIPHAYCQYHFLDHVMEPITLRDSHLAKELKKVVRSFSIIVNLPKGQLDPANPEYNPLYDYLSPLAEMLLCAIAVSSKKWSIFKGKEIFENLKCVWASLKEMPLEIRPGKIERSILAVKNRLGILLDNNKTLYKEIVHLLEDTNDLRKRLDTDLNTPKYVKKKVKTWVYRLQSRLKYRKMEYKPENLTYEQFNYKTELPTIWQQWVRLESSYHKGLYHSYKNDTIEKTNNAKEQLINRIKRHFKKWMGQQEYQDVFERHASSYSRLVDLKLDDDQIHEILWKHTVAYVEGYTNELSAFGPVKKRDWRIREKKGEFLRVLRKNMKAFKST